MSRKCSRSLATNENGSAAVSCVVKNAPEIGSVVANSISDGEASRYDEHCRE